MAKPKVLRKILVSKHVHDVIRDLKQEGWPVIVEHRDKAVFLRGHDVTARAGKSKYN